MVTLEIDVEAEIDLLYQLPLGEFVAARTALAAKLKANGDAQGTSRVKALARPNISAWAANQVYWTAQREFEALQASTRRLQQTQAEGALDTALREATKERREAQAAVMGRAESILSGAGQGLSTDILRRISATLEALAAEPALPEGIRPGRLIRDLELPGFEAVLRLARDSSRAQKPPERAAFRGVDPERPSGARLSLAPETTDDPRPGALDQARAALAEAEKSLDRARREAREAAGARSVAEKRAEAAHDELGEVTRRMERAKERVAGSAAAATAARHEDERTTAARDAAEAARDAALRTVREVE
jgi:hypothetical protein